MCNQNEVIQTISLWVSSLTDNAIHLCSVINGHIHFNDTFFTTVIAFQTGIIAFLVPLSIDIISKISEKYSSDVIINVFEDHWTNKCLPVLLLMNIAFASILILIDKENAIFSPLSWFVAALLLISFVATIIIINRIKKFIKNTEQIIEQLARQAEDAI